MTGDALIINVPLAIFNLLLCRRSMVEASLYFECPVTHRHCSVLWMPAGARRFCSRQTWGRRVAYASQFGTPVDRAHFGQAKIKSRLIGNCDPDEWDLPPKPKWMRWRTYNRFEQKFDKYEDALNEGTFALLARLMGEVG
ncbi:MAG: hypothetical protein WB662_06425 [Methyloceanibacter sp.]|jgi:hypothetical protein